MAGSHEQRLAKLEEALKPPGAIVCIEQYPCESEADLDRKADAARGRDAREGDLRLVIVLSSFARLHCPPEPHTHPDGSPGNLAAPEVVDPIDVKIQALEAQIARLREARP